MSAASETPLQSGALVAASEPAASAPTDSPPAENQSALDEPAVDGKGSNEDCLDEYKSSFWPYFELFKNPAKGWTEGYGAFFKIQHENIDTHLQAFAFWCIIKIYVVLVRELFRFILIGCVIGLAGMAISGMVMGLIFGFCLSHLFWFIVIYRKGCCGPIGYVVMGSLSAIGVTLAFVFFISSATSLMWELFPAIIPSDLLELVNMVPSIFQAILLFTLYQKEKNGEVRGAGVVVKDSQVAPAPMEVDAELKEAMPSKDVENP